METLEMTKKRELGQFFTTNNNWLKSNIKDFILSSKCSSVYDPFAGSGDLLKVATELGFEHTKGLDIDKKLGWDFNDSLLEIPTVQNAIIITNPPYLSNYSAKRKHLWKNVGDYFNLTSYDNIYFLALKNILKAQKKAVVILPETFINSPFPKDRVFSINILEENPFTDTENPVCVVCFDEHVKPLSEVKVFKNETFISSLGDLEEKRLKPIHSHHIKFNILHGKIGLRAVDTTDPKKKISFMRKEDLDYDMKGIKHSSRLITVVDTRINEKKIDFFIDSCNNILSDYRYETHDILLSPFKGNMKDGIRRRRLDYETARAIMERGFDLVGGINYAKES